MGMLPAFSKPPSISACKEASIMLGLESAVHLFAGTLVCSFILSHSFIHSHAHSFTHTHSQIHSLVHTLTLSLAPGSLGRGRGFRVSPGRQWRAGFFSARPGVLASVS